MPVTFTDDERFLIQQLAKTPDEFKKLGQNDLDRVAELLVKHMGDMKFNKKLRAYTKELEKQLETDNNTQNDQLYQSAVMLAKFIFKTKDYESISSISRKIQINKDLVKHNLDIVEEEKLSVKEFAQFIRFSDLNISIDNTNFKLQLEYINQKYNNKVFRELYHNISSSHSVVSDIKQNIIESKSYKTNDISIDVIKKKNTARDVAPPLTDLSGPIAQFLSTYGHVAPLYTIEGPNTKKITKESHVDSKNYRITQKDVIGILSADTLRIKPTQLINESFIPQLQKVYGEKEWKKHIKTTYQTLADNLHHSLELSNIRIQELNVLSEKGYEQIKGLNKQVQDLKNSDPNSTQITSLQEQINNLQASQNSTHEQIDLLRAKSLISFDKARLTPLKWFSPKALVQGHTKLGHKNDFRKLSNEMFNPTEENKKMICSEFGAVTIAASIDQLNRIVALDLQAAGLIDKEQEIFKNPIPKNERIDKIHPGRLVHLLKKAGAVEVHNETLDQYVKRNDLTSMKTANIELDLPNKILFLLKNSKDKDDFLDKANKNLAIYLEAYKVDKEVINQIQKNAQEQFAEFHQRKNETGIITSIKKLCKGIAVSLHLREKEKSTKKLSGNILTQVEKIRRQRAHENTVNTKYYTSFVQNKTSRTR
jgi:hypothetical protein